LDLDQCDVCAGVAPNKAGFDLSAVLQRDRDELCVFDDMMVGDDVTFGSIDDDAGACRTGLPLRHTLVWQSEIAPEEGIAQQRIVVSSRPGQHCDVDHRWRRRFKHRGQGQHAPAFIKDRSAREGWMADR
jgi:hypothetical protein